MKFENQTLSTSVYTNDDYSEASITFWPSNEDGVETAMLHFKVKNDSDGTCEPEPFKITYNKEALNTGKKINIEIADNGFIVKTGGDVKIAESEYILKTMIDDMIKTKSIHEIDYDIDEHDFANMQDAINRINVELGR